MKGAAGEDEPGHHSPAFHTLFSWLPPRPAPAVRSPPPRGGSAGDIPGKAGRRKQPRLCPSPASPHTPDRGGITRGGAGEGTPSPSKRTILALPKVPRPGAGALVVREREGRKPGEATQNTIFHRYLPIHCSHVPHPSRASRSSPARGGSAGDIPGKAGPGKQPRLYPSSASPHAPDRGDITRGGAGEGTPSPSTKTILALLNVPRAGAGAFVVRTRKGRKPGKANPDTTFLSPPHPTPAVRSSPPTEIATPI